MCVGVFNSVKEEVFWRNYFYRVSLIKQSAQLTALAAQQQQQQDVDERGASVSPEDVILTGQLSIWGRNELLAFIHHLIITMLTVETQKYWEGMPLAAGNAFYQHAIKNNQTFY